MIIGVIGSSTFTKYGTVKSIMDKLQSQLATSAIEFATIDLGSTIDSTEGLSYLIARYAYHELRPIHIYKTKWNDIYHPNARIKERHGRKYNSSAIKNRDDDFFEKVDCVVFIHNNENPVIDLITQAEKRKITIFNFNLDLLKF